MKLAMRQASAAAIIAIIGLATVPAFAQERPASPVAVKPGEVTAEEMAKRWGGDMKSGVAAAGPEVDKKAIDAPVVEPGYKLPRLADGRPDMTGVWSNASNTAMRRPAASKNLVMTDAEWVTARANNPQNIRQATDDKQNADTVNDGKDLKSGRGYNSFWIDPGNNYAMVKGTWRTSWIVEPANGQMPMKAGVRPFGPRLGNGYDNPEERNINERCIILGTSGPPIGNYLYNNNLTIVQSPDHVVIESEMIHDARIIPLNAKHKPAELAPWMGDSVGWYEGDTLVIETVNMTRGGGGVPISPGGKIIERFSRYNANQVFYEFEVDDSSLYTQKWKGQMALNAVSGMYEYACHEGNYAMHSILSGGRKNDRLGIKNDGTKDGGE